MLTTPTVGEPVRLAPTRTGAHLELRGVRQHAGRRRILDRVDASILPGEVVALVGPSGAGKTTLLETMAGLRSPTGGSVLVDGHDLYDPSEAREPVGFAPQDDIIHTDLPLRRTLLYAAALRLPAAIPRATIERIVDETLAELDLTERADVTVGSLSGGQRKRACIAVELLTRPRALFLDEPTSGLDPITAREVMRLLRRLADHGTTIVLTTHHPADLDACDRVVFLERGGRTALVAAPDEARRHFGTDDLATAYEHLIAGSATPEVAQELAGAVEDDGPTPARRRAVRAESPVGALRQWTVLSRRTADLLVRNRLTIAVLVGSPALVVTMMAVLFRPGTLDATSGNVMPAVQTVFWLSFAGFFFGLTYGLLQIVGERTILQHEMRGGLRVGPYVASKVTVLAPVLVAVSALMLLVLRGLDRLPDADASVYAALLVTLVIEAAAALALGLLASAAVRDPSQAMLALPMLCFPQVLFAGAVVAVPEMATAGQGISYGLVNRWAFESLGRTFDLQATVVGQPGASAYEQAFTGSAAAGWLVLATLGLACTAGTVLVLRKTMR